LNERFRSVFGRDPDVAAAAPGRVNLIGEHTDYNGGYVLPTVLPQETRVLVARRHDRMVRACSAEISGSRVISVELGSELRAHSWIDYIQGVTWALAERGADLYGVDMFVTSTVPIGKGLSSSASLEVAVARALRQSLDLLLSDIEIAMTAHRAETAFVDAPVGIMDQMVCSLGARSTALFLDTRTITFDRVPLPASIELGVIDSGIAHSHATGQYRTRRRECEESAGLLEVVELRDLAIDDLQRIALLPEPLNRRARHVVTENARVLAAVTAIRNEDLIGLGRLFLESHASMRDDFDVSMPEIDLLVEIAARTPGVYGARLTGGGFGGAIVLLCEHGAATDATRSAARAYRRMTQRAGQVLVPQQIAAA
jgi:galactokinase